MMESRNSEFFAGTGPEEEADGAPIGWEAVAQKDKLLGRGKEIVQRAFSWQAAVGSQEDRSAYGRARSDTTRDHKESRLHVYL